MPRFIWRSSVAVEAATLDDALEIIEAAFPTEDWHPTLHEHIMVWTPWGEPDDVELDAPEPPCSCPPDLVERRGWRSDCPAHGRVPAYRPEEASR